MHGIDQVTSVGLVMIHYAVEVLALCKEIQEKVEV